MVKIISIKIDQVGFIEHDEYAGCSPDGLINEDGGWETKAHDDVKHFKLIVNGEKEIESKYLWQIQMTLMITKRDYWIYTAYNPNFSKSLLSFKILPDEEKFEKLEEGLKLGKKKILAIMETEIEEQYNQLLKNE